MYQSLLTRKYLTRRVMPLLSAVAVTLCVAMVIITWSVMGGFLKTLLESGRTLIGDVKIEWPNRGFPHYEDLIDRLEAEPGIVAATPVIEGFGVLRLPDGRVLPALIRGVDPESLARVTSFEDTLHWKPLETPTRHDADGQDLRLEELPDLAASLEWPSELSAVERYALIDRSWEDVEQAALSLTREGLDSGEPEGAMVLGIELTGLNTRQRGWYSPRAVLVPQPDGTGREQRLFLPINGELALTVLPLDASGQAIEPVTRVVPVANEFKTGVFDIDSQTVLLRLDVLQQMLRMDEARRLVEEGGIAIDPETGEPTVLPDVTEVDPARVTAVLVRAADGIDADAAKQICQTVYAGFAADYPGEVPNAGFRGIQTWRELNAQMIGAVQKETALVLFIFSFISLTAVFLVWAIFWSMVSEKTRDVGILRSLGASSFGIAWLFLRYAFAIGVLGSLAGGAIAWIIVTNINPIHETLGELFGLVIWDPSVYYFSEIPSEVDPARAAMVMVGGVLSAVVGSLMPAIRAARMNPVRALRFE